MKQSKIKLIMMAALAIISSACSVSEPKNDAKDENYNLRLTSISTNSSDFVDVSYDNKGRVTYLRRSEDFMTISYSPLSISLFIEGEDINWENIHLNSQGYITSFSMVYFGYDNAEKYSYNIDYDNGGHLIKIVEDGKYTSEFKWDTMGRMIEMKEEWEDESYHAFYEYYPFQNTHQQWDPNVPMFSYLVSFSVLLGVAPSNFVKSIRIIEKDIYHEEYESTLHYNYFLDNNGWIMQSKITYDDYDSFQRMVWHYQKI